MIFINLKTIGFKLVNFVPFVYQLIDYNLTYSSILGSLSRIMIVIDFGFIFTFFLLWDLGMAIDIRRLK